MNPIHRSPVLMHTDGVIVYTQYAMELESFFFSSYKETWPYRKGCLRPGESQAVSVF